MSAAPKKKDEQEIEALELPNDREIGLSRNFEDPALDELIPESKEPSAPMPPPISLVQEAAEAVQELVLDAQSPMAIPTEGGGPELVLGGEGLEAGQELVLGGGSLNSGPEFVVGGENLNAGSELVLGEGPVAAQEFVLGGASATPALEPAQEIGSGSFNIDFSLDSENQAGAPAVPELPTIPSGQAESVRVAAIPEPPSRPLPKPLPKIVNPNPEPDEPEQRPLSFDAPEAPAVAEKILAQAKTEAPDLSKKRDLARIEISEKLFELVVSELSFDKLVEAGLAVIVKGVNAQTGSILELDAEHEDFFFRSSLGSGSAPIEQLKAFRVPINKGIVGHVASSGEPLLLKNLEEDKLQMRAISAAVGFDAVTCMAAPIEVQGQAYGVIEVFNRLDGGFFEEEDLKTLVESVRMLAKVLEVRFLTAELYRRLR